MKPRPRRALKAEVFELFGAGVNAIVEVRRTTAGQPGPEALDSVSVSDMVALPLESTTMIVTPEQAAELLCAGPDLCGDTDEVGARRCANVACMAWTWIGQRNDMTGAIHDSRGMRDAALTGDAVENFTAVGGCGYVHR